MEANTVHGLLVNTDAIVAAVRANAIQPLERLALGKLIRSCAAVPIFSKWRMSFLMAFILELSPLLKSHNNLQQIDGFEEIALRYCKIMDRIDELGLGECYNLQPLMNGKEVAQLLGIKPGPTIGKYLQRLIEWQLEDPELTKQGCSLKMREGINQ